MSLLPRTYIAPTPKKACIFTNKALSLLCNSIEKIGDTCHFVFLAPPFDNLRLKVASAFANPDIQ